MKNLQIYAIYDVKAKLFSNQPFFMQSNGVAIRSFATACEDQNTDFHKYPSDFSLYHLGEYDMETGKIITLEQAVQIANASEFVKKD